MENFLTFRAASVYIHIPFCDQKCAYCDFFSIGKKSVSREIWSNYENALLKEIDQFEQSIPDDIIFCTIFFGGGTPTKAPAQMLARIIKRLQALPRARIREITLEANPESVECEKLEIYKNAGVNRISVGIQSRDSSVLSYLGRDYSKKVYRDVFKKIRSKNFINFNADFILGVPGLKTKTLLNDLQWAIDEGVSHISAYALTIEPNTPLSAFIKSRMKKKPSERRAWLHMRQTENFLIKKGFLQYEVSNFSLPRRQSLHNLIYWKYRPYIGFGVAAHSFYAGNRFFNSNSLQGYCNGDSVKKSLSNNAVDPFIGWFRILEPQSMKFIESILGKQHFYFFEQKCISWEKKGYVKVNTSFFQMTKEGIMQSDLMLQEWYDQILQLSKL